MVEKKYRVILGKDENEIVSSILNERPSEKAVRDFAEMYGADFSRLAELNIVPPEDGGCWFCSTTEPTDLVFDGEFDTFVHLDCLCEALILDPDNPEAKIMSYLLEDDE